jgi:hypothetical protein
MGPQKNPRGYKTGGRKKGTPNSPIAGYKAKYLPREIADQLTKLDQSGGPTMAEIQVNNARWINGLATEERDKGNAELATRYASMAAKIAHDVSPFLYSSRQQIKHSGDEVEPPIRVESLSDYQLEMLIRRLRKG